MRVYIAGPMTGHPELNFPAFIQARTKLKELGYDAVSPTEFSNDDPAGELGEDRMSWEDYMRRDIPLLLSCQGICLLRGWESSKGASLEFHIAKTLSMRVITIPDKE